MATSLSEFRRYVEPYATGVTIFEVLHNAREVVRDFCQRSKCWQVLLTPFPSVVGQSEYVLTPPQGTVIAQVEEVFFGDSDHIDSSGMDDLWGVFRANWQTIGSGAPVKFSQIDPSTLRLYYPPDSVTNIYVRAALKPSVITRLADTTIPDWVFDQFAVWIADGILCRLYGTPNKPYSDAKLYLDRSMRFEQHVGAAKVRVARSFGRRELESTPVFF